MYVPVLVLSVAFAYAEKQAPLLPLRDGYQMPALALGTWLGHAATSQLQPNSSEVERAVSWALEAGYRHVDTAARYQVEGQVGRALAARAVPREQLFVTTKLWNDAHAQAAVTPALRASLARLRLDYVDLYLIHWPGGQFANLTYDYTDYVETWCGMVAAQRAGLARSIGVSNFNQDMLERIREHGLPTPAVLQVEINLNLQQPTLLSYCRARNITVMGYSPFGSLFPSRAAAHAPPPRVDDPALVAMATKYNKTVPQVALRYLVELGVVPIPKSVTKARIEQNIDVFDFSLSESDKVLLRGFDRGYRTMPQLKWLDHPYYPFENNHSIGKTR